MQSWNSVKGSWQSQIPRFWTVLQVPRPLQWLSSLHLNTVKMDNMYMTMILFNFYCNITCTIQFFVPPWITITFPIIADAFVIAIEITWTVKHCKNNRIGLRFFEKEILSILSNISNSWFAKLLSFFCVSFSGERKIKRVYFSVNLSI